MQLKMIRDVNFTEGLKDLLTFTGSVTFGSYGSTTLAYRAIAKECGIISQDNTDSLVMNGMDFIETVGGGNYFIKFIGKLRIFN